MQPGANTKLKAQGGLIQPATCYRNCRAGAGPPSACQGGTKWYKTCRYKIHRARPWHCQRGHRGQDASMRAWRKGAVACLDDINASGGSSMWSPRAGVASPAFVGWGTAKVQREQIETPACMHMGCSEQPCAQQTTGAAPPHPSPASQPACTLLRTQLHTGLTEGSGSYMQSWHDQNRPTHHSLTHCCLEAQQATHGLEATMS